MQYILVLSGKFQKSKGFFTDDFSRKMHKPTEGENKKKHKFYIRSIIRILFFHLRANLLETVTKVVVLEI